MATLLIVDDSAIMRKNLQTLLSDAGHQVIGEASNGFEAIEVYERLRPELVTMDITMPGLDGVRAVQQIMARFPEARIIMVSAEHQKSLVYEALKSGARHYLTKPLRLVQLRDVLAQVLDKPLAPEPCGGAAPVIAAVNHRGFALNDSLGRLRLNLSESFSVADCPALRQALAPLAQVAPLSLELSACPGVQWNTALVKALHELLSQWHSQHGPARWL